MGSDPAANSPGSQVATQHESDSNGRPSDRNAMQAPAPAGRPGIRSQLPARRPGGTFAETGIHPGPDGPMGDDEAVSVEFQARLLAAAGQAILATDPAGRVLYWNAAAEELYGWTRDEAVGAGIGSLVPAAAGWEDVARDTVAQVRQGRTWSGELWVQRKDGTTLPALVTFTPLHDDDGSLVANIGVSSDFSERLRDEATAAELSAIVSSSSDAIFSNDLDGRITTWNRAASRLFGYDPDEIIGEHLRRLGTPEMAGAIDAILASVLAGASVSEAETVGRRVDGSVLNLSVTMSPMRDRTSTVVGASTIARDITDRVESDRRTEADHRRLIDAQASAMLGSFEVDLENGVITVSEEFWRIIGRPPHGEPFQDFSFVHVDDRARIEEALGRVIAGEASVECTHRVVRPSGEVRWVVTRSSRFRDPSDRLIGGTMLDITERREAELATEHLAFHDQLTGLSNRTSLTARLDRELADSARTGHRVAVALIDLDQFKVINDSLGHAAGDEVLKVAAQRLSASLVPGEQIARFGGDEFAVIRCGVVDVEECNDLGARLLSSLDAPMSVEHREFQLSMSVGIAVSDPTDTADSMFRDADTAMYDAKESGRSRVAMFDESLRLRSRRRLDLGEELRTALERDELSVVFQPVIDLARSRTVGFEALLRWVSPTMGAIRPDEFIPIAEETGLILPIGDWVLQRSLAQIAQWRRARTEHTELWVAVNLSARQTESNDLVERVAAALDTAGVPASALHLEITESVLMDKIERSLETMTALRDLGIRLSIDDFGTGYSSLSYLKRLPVATLKIDRSFVDGLGTDPDDTSIVQAIVSLAHTLHLDVLAEGVETETQLRTLIELGCEQGQGFIWGPGLDAAQATEWLTRHDT